MFRTFGTFLFFFFSSSHPASAEILDPGQFGRSEEIVSIENLNITRDISIAGNLLCQDGQYLFFKDLKACLEMKKQDAGKDSISCGPDLTLAPINEIEEIFYEEGPNRKFIWRFFSIKTSYETKKYQLISDEVPERYKLVEKRIDAIEQCPNRPRLPATNVLWTREASESQKYLVKALLKNNILVVNSPYGNLDSIANPTTPSDVRTHILKEIPLKTPFCNPDVTNEQVLQLMGGSRTGGGLNEFENLMLQDISTEMNLFSPLSQKQWNELIEKPFDPSIEAYEVSCQPTGQAF